MLTGQENVVHRRTRGRPTNGLVNMVIGRLSPVVAGRECDDRIAGDGECLTRTGTTSIGARPIGRKVSRRELVTANYDRLLLYWPAVANPMFADALKSPFAPE